MEQPVMKKRGIYSVIVTMLVVWVTTFACLMYIERLQLGNKLQSRYQRELYDLIGNVQNLESDLSKVRVTSSVQQTSLLFGDIWRQAGSAEDRINSLPISHSAISKTSKFLSQVSDFSYALVKGVNNGKKLSDDDFKSLESLRNNAAYLRNVLIRLEGDIGEGKIMWSEITSQGRRILGKAQTNIIDSKFASVDKVMQGQPTLIYDGPYSENVLNIKPKVLAEKQITPEEAKKRVAQLIGSEKIAEMGSYSAKGDGKIPAYPFYVRLKGRDKSTPINIDVSKNGGHIVYMLDTRGVGQPRIGVKEAIDKGLAFLSSHDYADMIPSFSQKYDNMLVVNYVSTQKSGSSNVVVYPDSVKLKIALDNGEILGLEADKYLVCHSERNIPSARISLDKARAQASPKIVVENARLVIIPLLSSREVFCYEFIGNTGGTKYAVYINAENGGEENILQIIDTPEGELAL